MRITTQRFVSSIAITATSVVLSALPIGHILAGALAATAGCIIAFISARSISRSIAKAVSISRRIASGQLDNVINDAQGGEIGELLVHLRDIQSRLTSRTESDRTTGPETSRLTRALDSLKTGVMIADTNYDIVYANTAVETLLSSAEAEIRQDLPNFSVARLRGSSIDLFHQNPSHQRRMLAELRETHHAQIKFGGRVLSLVITPVRSDQGERLGTVIEWSDRTAEAVVENEMQRMLSAVIEGDLARRIDTSGKTGFFESMSRGINQLAENLADIVSKVKTAASEVYRGAEEISQGNTNLSQRTEEQSSSLEETASSMEEMTSTVKQNADNAAQANQLAMAARDQAEKGGAVVAKAVSAMHGINEASTRITDIISVIDEIAFQTNLLALNAAVEAARAGEQGRGFAVVASEVRALAGRSATAAKEIKELIQDSGKKVEDGSVLVSQSGQTLEQIVGSVKKVSDIVAEIAAASREQSSGIEQVNKAVMQMDEMTQQNAALVEQATAASQAMAEQARDLTHIMDRYRMSGEPTSTSTFEEATPAPSARASNTRSASMTAAPKTPERRKTGRPWTAQAAKTTKAVASAKAEPAAETVSRKISGASSGEDWEEF